MAEELDTSGSEAAAAAEALKSELSQPAEPQVDSADPDPLAFDEEALPERSGFFDDDESAAALVEDETISGTAPEVQAAEEAAAVAKFKYKANGQDKEISFDEARKLLSQHDGNQKGYKLAAKANRELKQLRKDLAAAQEAQTSLQELRALKDDPASLIEAVTGKSMRDYIQEEVERQNKYQLATPEERAQMDYLQKQAELEARVAKQEAQLTAREEELRAEARSARKEALGEKLRSAMEAHYVPNDDPMVDNTLREMFFKTSVGHIQKYHSQGYKVNDKLVNAVFKRNARVLGTHRTSNINQEVAKVSAKKSEAATKQAQQAATANYSSPKIPKISGFRPTEIFESMKRRLR